MAMAKTFELSSLSFYNQEFLQFFYSTIPYLSNPDKK